MPTQRAVGRRVSAARHPPRSVVDVRLVPYLSRLQASRSGRDLLAEVRKAGASVVVISDAEFRRRFSTDSIAASLDDEGGVPRLVLGEGFLSTSAAHVTMAIAHEAAHLVDRRRFNAFSAQHPGDGLVWAESLAAAVQGQVARELGIFDPGPGGSAMRQNGTLRSAEQVARVLRTQPGYVEHVDPSLRPALRWPLSMAHPTLRRILHRRAAQPRPEVPGS